MKTTNSTFSTPAFCFVGLLVTLLNSAGGATFIVLNTSDAGFGSLRQAINDANALPGLDAIAFNLPGAGPFAIRPLTGLPDVADPVLIDATTQPGFAGTPLIELDGSVARLPADGLRILSGNSVVRGFVINRWSAFGVLLTGGGNNRIEGNFIGTDLVGTAAAGNSGGIGIISSANNVIGGTLAGVRNVISGNLGTGVHIEPGSDNSVQGNFVGTDVTGTAAIPNGRAGVFIFDGGGNIVGGTTPEERNVISGNHQHGVEIGGLNSQPNVIQGNFIGTDVSGSVAVPNLNGINANSSSSQQIGGTAPGTGNLISGNTSIGVGINAGHVEGNLIGTDHTGTVALGNGSGVFLAGSGVMLGGNSTAARNIISGNQSYGVAMFGAGSFGNFVRGNFIGTDVTGSLAIGNGQAGVSTQANPAGNTIGGVNPGEGNLISGNQTGVDIRSSGNVVQGNLVGTDTAGTATLGNVIGIALYTGATDNLIGGEVVGAGNVISGNTQRGIQLQGASGNRIHGNIIGSDVSETTALGNGEGVTVVDASANEIGGVNPGEGNLIAHSATAGVFVWNLGPPGSTVGNAIRGNSIHSNGDLGIDLGVNGPTPNDCLDADVGENLRQNFPTILSASAGAGSITIRGTLHSAPNTSFDLEFFANSACDAGGLNEGEAFLGAAQVTTDANGNSSYEVMFAAPATSAQCITATATDSTGNTSEFSRTEAPLSIPPHLTGISGPDPIPVGGIASVTVTFTDPDASPSHSCTFSWGDASQTTEIVVGIGSCTSHHAYTTSGVYRVWVTVTDSCGASDTAVHEFVVVYDPNGGFVTGGGWINSPAGAFTANPSLTGKANFGFVSKYQKGANVPTGDTEFQFKAGNLNFKSTSYDWLVAAGAKAKYKGSGTINGSGDYAFQLSATDGQVNGGGVDRFRIKIWNKSGGGVIYDNQPGDPDTADATTALAGGSIVVHKP